LKDSGVVTFVSVVGMIFGILGLIGSIVPVFGIIFIYVSVPAIAISIVSLGLAYYKKSSKTMPVVAIAISFVAILLSVFQYSALKSVGEKTKYETNILLNNMSKEKKNDNELTPAIVYSPSKKLLNNKDNSAEQ